jgi:hypothetical protein
MPDQITLSSSEPPVVNPHKKNLNQVTAEFLQESKFNGIKHLFRVYDTRIVKIKKQTRKGPRDYLVNLVILDERPSFGIGIKLKFLVWSAIMGAVCFGVLQLKNLNLDLLAQYVKPYHFYVVAGLLGAASILLFITLLRSITFEWQFKSMHGRIPLVRFLMLNPGFSAVRSMLRHISDNIQLTRSNNYMSDEQELAAELQEHRRLRDEGLLSSRDYEKAKARIMKLQAGGTRRATAAMS